MRSSISRLVALVAAALHLLPAGLVRAAVPCDPPALRLEGRSAAADKIKVGFQSPLTGQQHRYWLERETIQTSVVQRYQDVNLSTSGSLNHTVNYTDTFDRQSGERTDGDYNVDIEVMLNGTQMGSFHGSYPRGGTEPPSLALAQGIRSSLLMAFDTSFNANSSRIVSDCTPG